MFITLLTQSTGMLSPISKVLGIVLDWIYQMMSGIGIENIAVCITIFTILINVLMIPSNIKTQKFSKMSALVQPEVNKIQAKYKGKRDEASLRRQNAETQAVYDKYGIKQTGGCLPSIITLLVLFAMFGVINKIPAYITPVKNLYEQVAEAIQGTSGYYTIMAAYAKSLAVSTSKWTEIANSTMTTDHIIDILCKFTPAKWVDLATQMPAVAGAAGSCVSVIAKIQSVNSFLGMDIIARPAFTSFSVILPFLVAGSQWLQQKTMMTQPQNTNTGNTMMDSMNSSMKFMPIMIGVMAFSMPIGLGIYWIVSALVRTVEQVIINKTIKDVDVDVDADAIIAKNSEKAKAKQAKREEELKSIETYSKTRTSKLGNIARTTTVNLQEPENMTAKSEPAVSADETEKQDEQNKKNKKGSNQKTSGSLSSYAHMLDKNGGK